MGNNPWKDLINQIKYDDESNQDNPWDYLINKTIYDNDSIQVKKKTKHKIGQEITIQKDFKINETISGTVRAVKEETQDIL